MKRLLVDAQLPPALARWLTDNGCAATHVGDCGLAAATDARIWDYAADQDFAVVTKDEDFARRRVLSIAGPTIVWVRLPNTRRRELLAWFEGVLPHIVAAIERGETLVELV